MDINLTLIIEGLAFFATAWLVMKYGWPPMMAAIEERQKKIAEGLAAAEQARLELKEADARVEVEIYQARQQATEIIEHAHRHASQILDKAREDAQTEQNRLKAAAAAEITSATERARSELRAQIAALIVDGAGHILQREVDANAHRKLLDELVAEL